MSRLTLIWEWDTEKRIGLLLSGPFAFWSVFRTALFSPIEIGLLGRSALDVGLRQRDLVGADPKR